MPAVSGCSGKAGASAFASEVAFELSEGAEHLKYGPTAGRRGVDRVGQGSQACVAFFQLHYGLDQMRPRARETIEFPGEENIAFPHKRDGLRQPGAVCLCARCTILEDPITSGGAQDVELERCFLIERRSSCIPFAQETPASSTTQFSSAQALEARCSWFAVSGMPRAKTNRATAAEAPKTKKSDAVAIAIDDYAGGGPAQRGGPLTSASRKLRASKDAGRKPALVDRMSGAPAFDMTSITVAIRRAPGRSHAAGACFFERSSCLPCLCSPCSCGFFDLTGFRCARDAPISSAWTTAPKAFVTPSPCAASILPGAS